jgi:hypothetical protein
MVLKIKKTTEENVIIETPKYFSKYNQVIKLCEKGLTKVGGDLIIHFPVSESKYFIDEVHELLVKGEVATEEQFQEKLAQSLVSLHNIIHN